MRRVQFILHDPSKCSGCMLCTIICSLKHFHKVSLELSAIRIKRLEEDWIRGDSEELFRAVICDQCAEVDPTPCISACPIGALKRDPRTGVVKIDSTACTSCRACELSCGKRALFYGKEELSMIKCDLCDGDPSCVKVCPDGALSLEEVARN